MSAKWYEEAEVGERFQTGGIVVTESHVMGFAGLTGDFFDLHVDDDFAHKLGFPGRVAHGILGLAIVDGLKNRAETRFRAVASLGWNWKFRKPILIGDRIRAEIEICGKRETKRADRGILVLEFKVRNQREEVVQEGTNELMVLRRPRGA
ncbi:MAG: MaoC family dehydratase N-terminal domain-containing protein [Betaproteobacteria bacterium]|nr:MaoC family dehydratase N-terminal domain-containing protein [Betaproteobacteria bacterium]